MRPELRRRLALGGVLAAALLIFYLLNPGPAQEAAVVSALPSTSPPAVPPAQPAPAPPNAQGLTLRGLTASGAIIEYQGGGQRLIAVGRDVLPGLSLQEVRQHSVLLASAGGTVELGFTGIVAPSGAAPAVQQSRPGQAQSEESLQYRLALAPRRTDGRVTGFAIRPGAEVPTLRRAGLRPGDVLIAVNGQPFDSSEKVMELAREIAGSYTAEFEFERNGRHMRASLPVNPRP